MKVNRFRGLVWVILLASLACRAVTELPDRVVTDSLPPTATPFMAEATLLPTDVRLPAPAFTPTLTPSLAAPAPPKVGEGQSFQVRVHPDGGLMMGDLVSFEVMAPAGQTLVEARVDIAQPGQAAFAQAGFSSYGLGHRIQATLTWAWDTQGLPAGDYPLVFTIQPGGITWSETFTLQPEQAVPTGLLQPSWAEARSECCTVYYLTGTAADRDLESLLLDMDIQAQDAASQMGMDFSVPITVTLLPRLLGHGGFATNDVNISYLDRNYASGQNEIVLHHEMIHVLDARLGGELRPTLLVEGLAVFLTGGHFKTEPLMPRAAVLLDSWGSPPRPGLGWFIPLETLANEFYPAQHEIGYLEAGALVEFIVQTWGWQAFNQFYRDIQYGPIQSVALDDALQKHFSLTLDELEGQFIQALRHLPADSSLAADVRLSIQYYDTVRRYQQALDPSAYFLTPWLPDAAEMRSLEITADYMRHPSGPANLTLETLLADAGEQIQTGAYRRAEQEIAAVNAVLDAFEQGWPDPFSASLLALDYAGVVQAVQQNPDWVGARPAAWVEPERIWIEADQARVWVSLAEADLVEVILRRDAQGIWQLLQAGG